MTEVLSIHPHPLPNDNVWSELRKNVLDTEECFEICIVANKLGVTDAPRVHFSHESLRRALGQSVGVIERMLDAVESKSGAEVQQALKEVKQFLGGFTV
jgi:hypothetical protein